MTANTRIGNVKAFGFLLKPEHCAYLGLGVAGRPPYREWRIAAIVLSAVNKALRTIRHKAFTSRERTHFSTLVRRFVFWGLSSEIRRFRDLESAPRDKIFSRNFLKIIWARAGPGGLTGPLGASVSPHLPLAAGRLD